MSKFGRNDPCPCGSGKKYKKCHLGKDLPNDIIMGIETTGVKATTRHEKASFQTLLDKYQTLQTVLAIGVLQVHPQNHGRNIHLEEIARDCLRVLKKNEALQAPSWQELQEGISECGAGMYLETPWNTFTDNVIYRNGNNIVYPGIYNQGSRILKEIIVSLTLVQSKLPEEFKTSVLSGVALLLQLSDLVAGALQHPRYINVRNESEVIEFPSYEEGVQMIDALSFTQEQIAKLCDPMDVNPSVLDHFFIDLDSPDFYNDDPDDNIVIKKPFLKIDGAIYLYMPTAIISSLIDFAFTQADQYGCKEEFLNVLQKIQKDVVLHALGRMNWRPISIPLPKDPLKLTNTELLFQFDNQKLAYVCFLDKGSPLSEESRNVPDPLVSRNKQILEHLLGEDPEMEILTLYVYPDVGIETMWQWGKPLKGNYTLMFRVHELELISNQNEVNALSLWKFAKALYRAGEKVKIVCPGMIELYGYYEENNGSLLDPNETNHGILPINGEYAARMFTEHEVKQDQHVIITRMNGQVGFLHIHRHREYAPIYKPDEPYTDFVLIVKSLSTPIWIKNNQTAPKGIRNWGHDIAEAIAFWMIRLSGDLENCLNQHRYLQYDIEVKIDYQLLNGGDFVIPDQFPETVDLLLDVTSNAITIAIPLEFGLLAWRSDNRADKVLIKTVVEGLKKCSMLRGNQIELTDEQLEKIIAKNLVPGHAKMVLFGNAYHDPRQDTRNLSVLHTIHKADTAQVLDDLLTYLPAGYIVPDVVDTHVEKLALVDEIISSLLARIKSRLAEFDGDKLLQALIKLNETCTRQKEFYEILRPPRIACFSSFEKEVEKIVDRSHDLVSTGHALRTLIEFTGTNLPKGSKKPGYDNIGELMALADELMAIGQLREILENNLADPKMGKLPSGRLGINKDFHRTVFDPLHQARAEGKVLLELEHFETKYIESQGKLTTKADGGNNADLNEAFGDEFGFSFDDLYRVIHLLTEEGFEKAEDVVIRTETHLLEKLTSAAIGMNKENTKHILDFLTLPQRSDIVFTKNDKNEYDKQFVPWRYNRPFSYLMKPLVNVKDSEEKNSFRYGYRHLHVSIHHYIYLVFNAKLPSPTSTKMKSFLGGIAGDLGKPFESEVREWLKKNTDLEIQPKEIYPHELSKRKADKKLGDIDVFAVDHIKKIIYSVECKNTRGARNVIEIVGEMNAYLGKEDSGEKPKILKHYERDQWLKNNLKFVESLIAGAEDYTVKSLVITADELSIEYLAGSKLLLPVVSFSKLKLEGLSVLEKL